MWEKIRILYLGTKENMPVTGLPDNVDIVDAEELDEQPKKPYEITVLDRELKEGELDFLRKAVKAYTLFVTGNVNIAGDTAKLYACKKGRRIEQSALSKFIMDEARNFFPESYGEKFGFGSLSIVQDFSGSVSWDGNSGVELNGSYGDEPAQIAFWRNNIPIFQGQAIELWLEYDKEPEVELTLKVIQFVSGSISEIRHVWEFSESELEHPVVVDNRWEQGNLFMSLSAKGEGRLKVIALHDRYSRRGWGCFIPGGERYVTNAREEVFAYFDPGDLKPPLNIYFSGYKTREGFEGYNIMRKMGCPFLLIAEARLEGGSFYMGSEEFEELIRRVIKKTMDELGFTGEQVVMSGLSMGTFGAMYYGCDFKPCAVIVGKPLASVGNVALNERLLRPGGFPTSLDVLHKICGALDDGSIQRLNDKFWDKFDAADWDNTKFIVSYMIEDDYDSEAYFDLLSHLNSGGVQLYSKGIHGRHNDNTGAIVGWFLSRYRSVLWEDFDRGMNS